MTTITTLIERIEKRLFLLPGLDVQIHAEDQIVEMLRGKYNNLFDDYWDMNFTYPMSGTLNGTTGEITTDISSQVLRFSDIHSVYYDEDERPLPRVTPGASFGRIRSRCVMPSGVATSVFKIAPADTTGLVHFWYRTRIADSVWDDNQFDTDIPMDDEILLNGVVYEFLVNDGSNDVAMAEYKAAYLARKKKIEQQQWQIPLFKHNLNRDGPLDRWE